MQQPSDQQKKTVTSPQKRPLHHQHCEDESQRTPDIIKMGSNIPNLPKFADPGAYGQHMSYPSYASPLNNFFQFIRKFWEI